MSQIDFTALDVFGSPFTDFETYVYYDGPQCFALKSKNLPLYYIVNAVDEDEQDESVSYLAVALSPDRFNAVRSGLVDFRDAFTRANSGQMFLVVVDYGEDNPLPRVSTIGAADLPQKWLPEADFRLGLKTQTIKEFDAAEVSELAEVQQRTIVAIEVESAFSNVTAFPTRATGQVQVAVAGVVEALSREFKSKRKFSREISLSTVDTRAASFVMLFAIETRTGMIEPAEVSGFVFEKLGRLISAAASGQDQVFLTELRTYTRKTRNRFRDIIKPLSEVGSGLAMTSSIANSREVRHFSASPAAIRTAVDAIENVKPAETWTDIERGILMGLVLGSKRFVIVDAANMKPYIGTMDQKAAVEANGLIVGDHSFVVARIRTETAFEAEDETSGIRHYLESISAVPLT